MRPWIHTCETKRQKTYQRCWKIKQNLCFLGMDLTPPAVESVHASGRCWEGQQTRNILPRQTEWKPLPYLSSRLLRGLVLFAQIIQVTRLLIPGPSCTLRKSSKDVRLAGRVCLMSGISAAEVGLWHEALPGTARAVWGRGWAHPLPPPAHSSGPPLPCWGFSVPLGHFAAPFSSGTHRRSGLNVGCPAHSLPSVKIRRGPCVIRVKTLSPKITMSVSTGWVSRQLSDAESLHLSPALTFCQCLRQGCCTPMPPTLVPTMAPILALLSVLTTQDSRILLSLRTPHPTASLGNFGWHPHLGSWTLFYSWGLSSYHCSSRFWRILQILLECTQKKTYFPP